MAILQLHEIVGAGFNKCFNFWFGHACSPACPVDRRCDPINFKHQIFPIPHQMCRTFDHNLGENGLVCSSSPVHFATIWPAKYRLFQCKAENVARQEYSWHAGFPQICQKTRRHSRSQRQNFEGSDWVTDSLFGSKWNLIMFPWTFRAYWIRPSQVQKIYKQF